MTNNNELKGSAGSDHLQLLIDAVVDYAIYMIGPQGQVSAGIQAHGV